MGDDGWQWVAIITVAKWFQTFFFGTSAFSLPSAQVNRVRVQITDMSHWKGTKVGSMFDHLFGPKYNFPPYTYRSTDGLLQPMHALDPSDSVAHSFDYFENRIYKGRLCLRYDPKVRWCYADRSTPTKWHGQWEFDAYEPGANIWFDTEGDDPRCWDQVRFFTGGPIGKDYKGNAIRIREIGCWFDTGVGWEFQQKEMTLGPITKDSYWPEGEPATVKLNGSWVTAPQTLFAWRPLINDA